YTLLVGVDSPISIARFVTPSAVRYDSLRDLAPIGMLNGLDAAWIDDATRRRWRTEWSAEFDTLRRNVQ
ncbi:MAG TPA: hypothetical protein VEQ87_21100, partial [Burkholderiales bacterium]|nr:hypothetical protein [Burkholderiales bacterium]